MQSHNMILALLSTSIFAEFADYRIANVRYFRHKLNIFIYNLILNISILDLKPQSLIV